MSKECQATEIIPHLPSAAVLSFSIKGHQASVQLIHQIIIIKRLCSVSNQNPFQTESATELPISNPAEDRRSCLSTERTIWRYLRRAHWPWLESWGRPTRSRQGHLEGGPPGECQVNAFSEKGTAFAGKGLLSASPLGWRRPPLSPSRQLWTVRIPEMYHHPHQPARTSSSALSISQ